MVDLWFDVVKFVWDLTRVLKHLSMTTLNLPASYRQIYLRQTTVLIDYSIYFRKFEDTFIHVKNVIANCGS